MSESHKKVNEILEEEFSLDEKKNYQRNEKKQKQSNKTERTKYNEQFLRVREKK